MDLITHFNLSALQNPGKNSFFGHDAVASLVVDGATCVTNLADLSHLQKRTLPDLESGSDGKAQQVETFRRDVFGKISRADFQTQANHLGDGFHRQKADLAMPLTGVRIVL